MIDMISTEMKLRYLERRLGELHIMKTDLAVQKYDSSMWYTHQMKGNAETFSFKQIGEIARELEDLCRLKSHAEAIQSLHRLFELVRKEIQFIQSLGK